MKVSDTANTHSQQQYAEEPAATIITPTSSVETLGTLFTIERQHETAVNASVPLESHSAAAAPIPPSVTSVTSGKRKYDRWHSDAAVEFTRLYRQHSDTQWTFKDFESLWDAQKYGAVDPERWRTRNQTESRREANVAEGKKKKKKRVRIA